MTDNLTRPSTAFSGHRLLSSGPLIEVALAVKNAADGGGDAPLLVFDDASGRVVDLDLRGTKADIVGRLSHAAPAGIAGSPPPIQAAADAAPTAPRGRGRPRLGVVAREVTLLPRHWEWLAAQPGGASVALRRLVDEARRTRGADHRTRTAREAAYRFMSAIAGDLPGFEEAARALFAGDRARFERQVAGWPEDVRAHATRLALGGAEGMAP